LEQRTLISNQERFGANDQKEQRLAGDTVVMNTAEQE
jgi:hypothetical protein